MDKEGEEEDKVKQDKEDKEEEEKLCSNFKWKEIILYGILRTVVPLASISSNQVMAYLIYLINFLLMPVNIC